MDGLYCVEHITRLLAAALILRVGRLCSALVLVVGASGQGSGVTTQSASFSRREEDLGSLEVAKPPGIRPRICPGSAVSEPLGLLWDDKEWLFAYGVDQWQLPIVWFGGRVNQSLGRLADLGLFRLMLIGRHSSYPSKSCPESLESQGSLSPADTLFIMMIRLPVVGQCTIPGCRPGWPSPSGSASQ